MRSDNVGGIAAFPRPRGGELTPPGRLGTADVEAFLNQLVGERQVAASTQNQALNALAFLNPHVLEDAIAPDHHYRGFRARLSAFGRPPG